MHFITFCALCKVKANEQKKQKIKHNKTGEFHNQSRFVNFGLTFQFATGRIRLLQEKIIIFSWLLLYLQQQKQQQ